MREREREGEREKRERERERERKEREREERERRERDEDTYKQHFVSIVLLIITKFYTHGIYIILNAWPITFNQSKVKVFSHPDCE